MMAEQLFEDDGTLACLRIPADESNKRFACKAERQENLIGWLKHTNSRNLQTH